MRSWIFHGVLEEETTRYSMEADGDVGIVVEMLVAFALLLSRSNRDNSEVRTQEGRGTWNSRCLPRAIMSRVARVLTTPSGLVGFDHKHRSS